MWFAECAVLSNIKFSECTYYIHIDMYVYTFIERCVHNLGHCFETYLSEIYILSRI